jgi:hypothetical protein
MAWIGEKEEQKISFGPKLDQAVRMTALLTIAAMAPAPLASSPARVQDRLNFRQGAAADHVHRASTG